MKPIEERKNLLREWGACFKCCASTAHLFKDCKEAMKCTECNSDRHIAALHPETMKPRSSKAPNPTTKQGGEEEERDTPPTMSVASKCTEVCGERSDDRSCSKICLVAVHPEGQPQRAKKDVCYHRRPEKPVAGQVRILRHVQHTRQRFSLHSQNVRRANGNYREESEWLHHMLNRRQSENAPSHTHRVQSHGGR
ncbi:hypothetical protein FKM82_021609 [Ascaphus truei]